MNKNRKLINAFLVSTMMLSGLSLDVSAADDKSVVRLSGNTRVETSVGVSTQAYDSADTVVVAGYNGEVDALTGTILASMKKAPLLLVSDKAADFKEVKSEITRLGAENVVLLGETNVISKSIADELKALGLNVSRVAGGDRFDTAIKVAEEAGAKHDHVFLTNDGRSGELADALATGPVSGRDQDPILLTSQAGLPSQTIKALKAMNVKRVTVVGGEKAVSNEVKTELEGLGIAVTRVAGDNRWETAEAIAKTYFENSDKVIVANDGRVSYADALVGGYLGAKEAAPILLTVPGELNVATKNFLGSNATFAYILGGNKVVSSTVESAIKTMIDEKADEELAVESVSAITAETLEVTFNSSANVEDVELAVTRGTTAVAGKFAWSNDNKTATFTADAKLRAGNYTVTATSKSDKDFKVTGTVEVTDQKVTKIVIENDVALTTDDSNKERRIAYAFYDVFDQYGESVRATTNITWTASVGKAVKADRTTGQLTLEKGDDKEFTYNEKIYLTGVDAKNGISVQKELTIGQVRALDTLEVAGFVKKGTSEIVENLPAGFKTAEYSMVFKSLDQNGNVYPIDTVTEDDVTFISDNPLLIEKVSEDVDRLVIDGVSYGSVEITPGMNVDQGGEVNITAIANKTGNQTVKNIVVGEVSILSSFEMLSPSGIIAEGEAIEIPFTAKAGEQEVTNFTTLARKAGINELKLNNPGTGSLQLEEKNDGTARLVYIPNAAEAAWKKGTTTNGIDRPVSLTTVVVGGNASNLMLSVSDKARPVGIKSVDFDNTVVEAGDTTINLSGDKETDSFTFVDQYGREMNESLAHEFFRAAEAGEFTSGSEFDGYNYSVKATYKGEDNVFTSNSEGIANNKAFEIKAGESVTFTAKEDVTTTAKSNMALDFEVIRYKSDQSVGLGNDKFDFTPVSSKKNEKLTVVDITAVKNFEVKELPRLQVVTDNSKNPTGATLDAEKLQEGATGALNTPAEKPVEVTGDYNGRPVNIPATYLELESDQLAIDTNTITKVKTYVKAGDGTAGTLEVAAKAAKATIGSVDFEAVTPGVAGNDISVEIVESTTDATDGNPVDAKVEVADQKVTITLGAEWNGTDASESAELTVGDLKTLIEGSTDAKDLINVTTEDTDITVSVAAENLKDGADLVPATDGTEATGQQGLTWGDFYDATTASFLRKDAKATIKATVKDNAGEIINTANRTVLLSDATPVATTIAGPETLTVLPDVTAIDVDAIQSAAKSDSYKVLDQYGEDFTADINFKAVNVKENETGYVANNFKITKNDTTDLVINGAERGDTFTLELRAGSATKTVQVTVGADKAAHIVNGTNNYLDNLLEALEQQRKDSQQ